MNRIQQAIEEAAARLNSCQRMYLSELDDYHKCIADIRAKCPHADVHADVWTYGTTYTCRNCGSQREDEPFNSMADYHSPDGA
jgi:hypothetical protein